MKVTMTAYHAVAEWKWDLPDEHDDTCGICRVAFISTCSKCRYPGDECPIMIGECTHTFHMHCISDWIQSDASQGRCPMCRQVYRPRAQINPTTPANQQPRPSTGGASNPQGRTNGGNTNANGNRTSGTGTGSGTRTR